MSRKEPTWPPTVGKPAPPSPRVRKNPDNKPLRIISKMSPADRYATGHRNYPVVLAQLAIAQSNLVRAGKDSAMPHFIAIVKEIERYYGIRFEQYEES